MLCQQFSLLTTKGVTDPLPEFLSSQEPSRFDNGAFPMDPLRLNAVEPRTLDRQPAWNDAHAMFAGASFLQHGLIMLMEPRFDVFAHMPGSVIPNQHEYMLVLRLEPLTQPLQKIGGHLADWTPGDEAQVHATTIGGEHTITGERFGIGIVLIRCKLL